MSEEMTAVSQDTGSATVEPTSSPDSSSSAAAPESAAASSPASSSASRTYREEDVQRLIRERVEQQKRSYEKRLSEFEKKQKDYEAVVQRANAGIEGLARGFGFMQEEPKKPWEADINPRLEALQKQMEEKLAQMDQGYRQKELYSQIKSDWERVQSTLPPALKGAAWVKELYAQRWRPGEDPAKAIADVVSFAAAQKAAEDNEAAQEKEAASRRVPVRGGPAAVATPGNSKDPLRKKLAAALKAGKA